MRFQVRISLPSRGLFASLTVLVHYRSIRVFSLGGGSPPSSNSTCPALLLTAFSTIQSVPRAITRYGRTSTGRLRFKLSAVGSSGARRYAGISVILFLEELIMFQFSSFASLPPYLYSDADTPCSGVGSPLRYLGINARLPAPQLSRLLRRFFACIRQSHPANCT